MTSLTHIAIIPARGGSRGIPRKNLEVVGGLPLVARTTRTALDSGTFAAVVVSTDDDEIAEVAERHGGRVVIRPADLAADTSLTEPVLEHALASVEESLDFAFDAIWLLQPTSPFLEAEDIRRARELLESDDCDSILSVFQDHTFSWSPTGSAGLIGPDYDPSHRPRRQDMPRAYTENGALYAVLRTLWDESHVRLGRRVMPVEMPPWRSLEIDSPDDLAAARALSALCRPSESNSNALRLAKVQALALDFDGVLTDNLVTVAEDGKESVTCSRGDGLALSRLRAAGIHAAVFSTERNPVVGFRCNKLAMDCFQALEDKPTAMASWLESIDVPRSRCAFVGNDLNDLAAMRFVGLAVAPRDAHPTAAAAADLVLDSPGGVGAVAEIIDLILQSR